MSFVTKPAIFLAAAVSIMLAPNAARADDPKVRLTLGAGITAGSLDGEATGSLSVGYRFSKRFSFDVEAAGADAAADRFFARPLNIGGLPTSTTARIGSFTTDGRGGTSFQNLNVVLPGLPGLGDLSVNSDGRTVLTTVGFRYHVPSSDARFQPYVSGGMGVSITEENFDVRILAADTRNRTSATTTVIDESTTHTGLAAVAGVGASVRVFKQLSVGVDARYYRLDRGRNIGTFGAGISYGF